MIAHNEKELILRLQEDNIDAFDALYMRYHQPIYKNIFKLIKDKDSSKDILQEVFISFWEKRHTLDPEISPGGWLFTVSYNKTIFYLKQRLKLSLIDPGTIVDNFCEYKSDESFKEERALLIKEAVDRLSTQKKRVFYLCKLQGKTYEETAKELRISRHTVKEYLSLAVINIKEYLLKNPPYSSSKNKIISVILICLVCSRL